MALAANRLFLALDLEQPGASAVDMLAKDRDRPAFRADRLRPGEPSARPPRLPDSRPKPDDAARAMFRAVPASSRRIAGVISLGHLRAAPPLDNQSNGGRR